MGIADIADVRELEQRAFASGWQEEAFNTELTQNSAARYLVMRGEDLQLVGYCGFWLIQDEAHVTSIAIDAGYRGQQLGKLLMHSMVTDAADNGAFWMTLEVRADNVVAQNLYRKFGFARVGIRPRYYAAEVDAWIMWAGNLCSDSYQERLRKLDPRKKQHV